MENLIIITVVGVIIGLVIRYIYKEKKRGTVCIGCPDSAACAAKGGCGSCNGCSGCANH